MASIWEPRLCGCAAAPLVRCIQDDRGFTLHPKEDHQALARQQYAGSLVQESTRKIEDAERGSAASDRLTIDASGDAPSKPPSKGRDHQGAPESALALSHVP